MRKSLSAALPLALVLAFAGGALAASGPRVIANVNVDLDHGLAFSQNKQNEPSRRTESPGPAATFRVSQQSDGCRAAIRASTSGPGAAPAASAGRVAPSPTTARSPIRFPSSAVSK